jgi:hypothetical protein
MTLKEVGDFINMIESFNRTESYFSYPFIKNALNEIAIPIPQFKMDVGKRFIRGRVNKEGEDFFHKASEISYIQEPFLIKDFGRANEPCQSMFYCSDSPKTAFIETCTMTRENVDLEGENLTWGVWEVVEPFPVSYVIGREIEEDINQTRKEITKRFLDFLSTQEPDLAEPLRYFHKYMAKKFEVIANGHSALYKVAAAYTNQVFNETYIAHNDTSRTPQRIGGILYASSLYPDEGMNLVLSPRTVDRHLKLIDVRLDRIVKKEGVYDGSDTVNAESIDLDSNIIKWIKA